MAASRLQDRSFEDEAVEEVTRLQWSSEGWTRSNDLLVKEEPIEIRIDGAPIAVLMRTPGHDEELVRGFLLTERIAAERGQIASIRSCDVVDLPEAEGNVFRVRLRADADFDLTRFRRNMFASSSCGICGKASVEQALVTASPFDSSPRWSMSELLEWGPRMRTQQTVFEQTGGLHAAAAFDAEGALMSVREDVGRHNAVDKVVGAATGPIGGLAVSGRLSFEIVQKALAARIQTVVAVSAPSALAVKLAEASRMLLVGFARGDRAAVYAGRRYLEN
ncbi:MAG: formate dehydrogenase accessory sulfurtransferase FdhD [Myxococcota bacterium]